MPKWVLLYCKRWLRAPLVEVVDEASWVEREVGTPQGGVIFPLLANLFLHYAFDQWMEQHYRWIRFERYAEIYCSSGASVEELARWYNTTLRGWITYYGKFSGTVIIVVGYGALWFSHSNYFL